MKVISQILPKIGCHGNVPWDRGQGRSSAPKNLSFGEKIAKIGPADPECHYAKWTNIVQFRHTFHFLPQFNSKTTEPIFTIFTRFRAISGAINACIRKTIVHFV